MSASNSTSTPEEPASTPSPSSDTSPSEAPTTPTNTPTSPTTAPTPSTTDEEVTTTVTSTSTPSTTSIPTTSLDPTTTSTTIASTRPTTTTSQPSSTTEDSTSAEETTTSAPSTTTSIPSSRTTTSSTVITTEFTTSESGSVRTITSISTATPIVAPDAPTTTTSGEGVMATGDPPRGGLSQPSTIAVAVVVPIAGVALLVVAAIFFWRKRKQRKDSEEERRKEVEDYNYNPNADPTLPDVGGAGGAYEMKEDGSSGYRGWGSTTLGSTGRKASTTMSGGAAGVAYSDSRGGAPSDTRSGEALMDGAVSPEGEILGAMGPSAADNRGNVHRGPSNASSSYSAAGRSDGSGENGIGVAYYDQYNNGPYGQQGAGELAGQPIIRDNPARRNTRIENPSHFPQQSAGISQNF